jgi:NTP pyrophosphatase (non-canonical NTP hydrolase)
MDMTMVTAINELAADINKGNRARGFWDGERNKGEMIALIHSELSEALEGLRKDNTSDKLPLHTAEEEEMADAVIRILDYAAGFGLNIGQAIASKLEYNANRPYKHGKKF